MKRIPNDFGNANPDLEGFFLNGGKYMVEQRACSITIAELRSKVEWRNREYIEAGWLVRPNLFLSGVEMSLSRDNPSSDWHLLPIGQEYKRIRINITQTPCKYGGCRDWLECPQCLKRRRTLYRDKGSFKCRRCLDLVYRTQKMNYRGIEPTVRKMMKLEETASFRGRTYKGQLTRRTKSHEKLRQQADLGMEYVASRLNDPK